MNKEITDGMKADLEKVCCDHMTCEDRGEYARCYLDVYRNCQHYPLKAIIEHLNLDDKFNKRNI